VRRPNHILCEKGSLGSKVAKKLKSLLVLAVGLALAYWFAARLDWAQVGAYWRQANVWMLVLGGVLINLTMLVRGLRWQAFLAPIARVRLRDAVAATSVGFGCIFVFGRAGEVARPLVLSLRTHLRPTATVATILIERIYDMVTVVVLFAVNLLFIKLPEDNLASSGWAGRQQQIGGLMLLGVGLGVGLLVLLRLRAAQVLRIVERLFGWLPGKVLTAVLNLVRHLADGLSVLLNLRELALTLIYTALVWLLVCLATWLTLGAFGLSYSAGEVIFVLGFGLVGSLVPTPRKVIPPAAAAAAGGMTFLGVEQNLAGAVALALHLVSFGAPFVLGLYYVARDGIGFGRLRELIAREQMEVGQAH
jgi:glycosyltransferase 2 family protein